MALPRGTLVLLASMIAACSSTNDAPPPASDAAPADGGGADVAEDTAVDDAPVDTGAVVDAGADAQDAGCAIPETVQSEACTACLGTKCCAVTSACLNDTSCRALDDCVNACAANGGGDAGDVRTCVQACYAAQAPAVQKAWRAYNDCLAAACVKNGNGPCQ